MSHFCIYYIIKLLLFDVFSCLVACRVIKEEKGEIDRFIQLNLKIQKKGDRFKFKGPRSHDISDKILSSKFKENGLFYRFR